MKKQALHIVLEPFTMGSTSISMFKQDVNVNFKHHENDLLVWACRMHAGQTGFHMLH